MALRATQGDEDAPTEQNPYREGRASSEDRSMFFFTIPPAKAFFGFQRSSVISLYREALSQDRRASRGLPEDNLP